MAAQSRNTTVLETVDTDAVDGYVAGRGRHLTVEQTQEAGFSRSGVADEEDEVAFADFEIDPVDGADSIRIHE